ncbi:MAG TPA: hypothetical protein VJZ32_07915 [Candidatus Bathyarchaeia archaeon]|nr:hypothetical protein [Candidatus Bathyarchaeia archaeon]
MEKRDLMVLSLVFFLAAAVFAVSSSPVFAQTPCIAQASYPAVSSPQYNSNIAVTVPVSASCSYTVGPLYAVGDAYDTTVSSDLGTVSTGLSLVGGGSYSGQLLFSLPTSTLGHTVQFSVSIYNNYNGQSGSPLATTSQSVTIGSSYNQSYCQSGYSNIGGTCYPSTNSYCQSGYSNIGGTCYPSTYQSYPYNNCPPGYANAGGTCYPPTYYSNCYNGYYYGGSSCYYPGYSNNYYSSNYYGSSSNGNGNGNWNNGNGNGNWNHGNGNGNWNHGNGNNNWNNGNGNGNWHHKSP